MLRQLNLLRTADGAWADCDELLSLLARLKGPSEPGTQGACPLLSLNTFCVWDGMVALFPYRTRVRRVHMRTPPTHFTYNLSTLDAVSAPGAAALRAAKPEAATADAWATVLALAALRARLHSEPRCGRTGRCGHHAMLNTAVH